MDKAGDLLPWIMGGLMIAAVAAAIAVSSKDRNAPASLPALREIAAPPLTSPPAPASTPDPVPATVPAPTEMPAAQTTQSAVPPAASSGQIWECTINGLKTFSGKPCGDKSLLREVGPVNGMEATPVLPYARSYEPEPRNEPEYSYAGDQENPVPSGQDVARTSYPVFIGIPVHERRRSNHAHRPDHGHYRVPPPPNK